MISSNTSEEFSESPVTLVARTTRAAPEHERIIWQVLLVGVIIAGFFLVRRAAQAEARLTVQWDNKTRAFQGHVTAGMTILDALNASMHAGQIPLQFMVDRDDKVIIVQLDGQAGKGSDRGIAFYLNAQKIDGETINKVSVHAHDEIVVKIASVR